MRPTLPLLPLLLLFGACPASAQDVAVQTSTGAPARPSSDPSPSARTADTQRPPPPGLLGDIGGLRPFLRDRGVELALRYASESAYNPHGGQRHVYRETGQLDFGITADLGRLAGLDGGTFQTTVTYRRGRDLGQDAGLGVLQQVQEVYGRGQTWRLTQFWYEQRLGRARVKVGRSSPGEDFEGFSCHFQNLSFCGSQPGNLVGDYWYNWPVSQWSARFRYDRGRSFGQVGVYEVNPRNLDREFFAWHLHGATGVLIPFELGWAGAAARTGRVASFRAGGWWSSSDGDDVLLDGGRQPRILTGTAPLRRSGRYGAWLAVQQQLTGRAENGKSVSGLNVFLNVTQADRLTAVTDNQISAGLFFKGLVPARLGDVLGLGVARTNVNRRAVRGGTALFYPDDPDAEYAAELYYSLHPTAWLEFRPNAQLVHHPGGRHDVRDVAVLGLKAAVTM